MSILIYIYNDMQILDHSTTIDMVLLFSGCVCSHVSTEYYLRLPDCILRLREVNQKSSGDLFAYIQHRA